MKAPDPSALRNRLQPGARSLLAATALGHSVSSPFLGQSFSHPWTPVLVSGGLRISKGLVDGFEPKINGKPMSGATGELPPILKLTGVTSETTETWAMLVATPNADGKLDKDSKLVIIHTASYGLSSLSTGSTPVAQIIWKNKKPVMALPVLFFNLKYEQKKQQTGEMKHYFR